MSICCGRPQSVCNYIARVKIIGNGDEEQIKQYAAVNKAIDKIGMAIELDNILDMDKLTYYGATKTPAIVIGSKLVSEGKVIDSDEAEKLIRKAVFGF